MPGVLRAKNDMILLCSDGFWGPLTEEELLAIREVGPETAREIGAFFALKQNRAVLDRLQKAGVNPRMQRRKRGDKLAGQTFVLTGLLNYLHKYKVRTP